jgi:Complex 1 protein (LYR family)
MAHQRSTLQLYRDCLRLARYIGTTHADPSKMGAVTNNLTDTVRSQFRRNMYETDAEKITEHREVAIKALTQYMFFYARTYVSSSILTTPNAQPHNPRGPHARTFPSPFFGRFGFFLLTHHFCTAMRCRRARSGGPRASPRREIYTKRPLRR